MLPRAPLLAGGAVQLRAAAELGGLSLAVPEAGQDHARLGDGLLGRHAGLERRRVPWHWLTSAVEDPYRTALAGAVAVPPSLAQRRLVLGPALQGRGAAAPLQALQGYIPMGGRHSAGSPVTARTPPRDQPPSCRVVPRRAASGPPGVRAD